jgi:hypothetical protein
MKSWLVALIFDDCDCDLSEEECAADFEHRTITYVVVAEREEEAIQLAEDEYPCSRHYGEVHARELQPGTLHPVAITPAQLKEVVR